MIEPNLVVGVPAPLKLHLACGQRKKDGFVNVDYEQTPAVDTLVDILNFPWPWADDSVSEIVTEHFIEHIPACCVGEMLRLMDNGGAIANGSSRVGQDYLLAFFDECYRVLKPDGIMKVVVPAAGSDRAFQDPTHRRFIPQAFFAYLDAGWRKSQGLQHYNVACDFDAKVVPYVDPSWGDRMRSKEAQAFGVIHYRNVTLDLSASLRAIKPSR